MDTQLLYHWANFRKMGNIEKRELFSRLIAEHTDLHCEFHIYRVLTRFTFQSLRRKYGEAFKLTQDEKQFDKILQELGLSPSTALNWYYSTLKDHPLKFEKNACADLLTGSICECCISDDLRKSLKENYEFRLASKRLYQTIVKAELFKDELAKKKIILNDEETRKSLRRIVEYDYYSHRYKKRRSYTLREVDKAIRRILEEKGVRAMTVLKWFYLLMKHPELLKKVYRGDIDPEDVFVKTGQQIMVDLRGDI